MVGYRDIYLTMNVHEKSVSDMIKSKFTPEEIKAYKQNFDLFDLNGDGVISARELEKVSRRMGYRMTKKDVKVRDNYIF